MSESISQSEPSVVIRVVARLNDGTKASFDAPVLDGEGHEEALKQVLAEPDVRVAFVRVK